MPMSCHGALQELRQDVHMTVALAGNPNVGKSVVFGYLTGIFVMHRLSPGLEPVKIENEKYETS